MNQTSLPRSLTKYLAGLAPDRRELLTPLLTEVHQALAQPEATVAMVVQVLAAHPLATPGQEAVLIEALARLPHPLMPAVLQTFFRSDSKAQRKALKKAWHHLKAQGIPVPEEYFKDAGPHILTPVAETTELAAYMSRIEGNGNRMIIFHLPGLNLPVNLLAALANDVEGLQDAYALPMSRKEVRRYLQEVRDDIPSALAPVDPAYAFGVLEACWHVNPAADSEAGQAYLQFRPLLQERLGAKISTDVRELLPQDLEMADYLQETATLLTTADFANWLLTAEEVRPWVEKFQAVKDSPLHLTEEQQQARYQDLARQAVQEFFPAPQRQLIAQRLLHMAYYLEQCGRPYEARLAHVAGLDVARERSILEEESPFLITLFLLPVQMSLDQATEQQARPESGRIITDLW